MLMLLVPPALGLVGYDCSSGNTNITEISLRDVGTCELPIMEEEPTSVYIQLLQINNFKSVHVQQCKVQIRRQIFYCGMSSHVSAVQNGLAEYMLDLDKDRCRRLQETGHLDLGNQVLTNFRKNASESRPVTLAGMLKTDGSCNGVPYSDHFNSYDSGVIVQATVTVTLRDYPATVDIENNKIHLSGGISCDFNRESCSDFEGGYNFWNRLPNDSCGFDKFVVLFEGPAKKGSVNAHTHFEHLYTVQTSDITFALTREKTMKTCGYDLIQTEHPKLFILEGTKGSFFTSQTVTSPKEMDMFAYINSKFVYVEKHVRLQLTDLYKDVVMQRCLLEQRVLRNSLSLATLQPDQFAYDFMKGPGYMAVIGGEVLYIIKCVPIIVKLRQTKECYQELAVSRGEDSYFLTPRTHILKRNGLQVNCNNILPTMYEVEGRWYKFLPKAAESKPPQQLQPKNQPTWEYKSIGNLASSGIYSQEDLDKLRDDVMFPADRPAILNILARKITGQHTNTHSVSLQGLLDVAAIEDMANNAWKKFIHGYERYGMLSAAFFMTIFIIKVLKTFIGTFINMFVLHSTYGCTYHLFGACWGALSNLFLFRYQRRTQRNIDPENIIDEGQELMPAKDQPAAAPRLGLNV